MMCSHYRKHSSLWRLCPVLCLPVWKMDLAFYWYISSSIGVGMHHYFMCQLTPVLRWELTLCDLSMGWLDKVVCSWMRQCGLGQHVGDTAEWVEVEGGLLGWAGWVGDYQIRGKDRKTDPSGWYFYRLLFHSPFAGLGFADVENRVACRPETVMRIASISKPVTMAAVARLVDQGKLDLHKPVTHYVKSWPEKYFQDEKVVWQTTGRCLSLLEAEGRSLQTKWQQTPDVDC